MSIAIAVPLTHLLHAPQVYHTFSEVKLAVKRVKEVPEWLAKDMQAAVMEQWEMALSDLSMAGYALDPEYIDHDVPRRQEVMDALKRVLRKYLDEKEMVSL